MSILLPFGRGLGEGLGGGGWPGSEGGVQHSSPKTLQHPLQAKLLGCQEDPAGITRISPGLLLISFCPETNHLSNNQRASHA